MNVLMSLGAAVAVLFFFYGLPPVTGMPVIQCWKVGNVSYSCYSRAGGLRVYEPSKENEHIFRKLLVTTDSPFTLPVFDSTTRFYHLELPSESPVDTASLSPSGAAPSKKSGQEETANGAEPNSSVETTPQQECCCTEASFYLFKNDSHPAIERRMVGEVKDGWEFTRKMCIQEVCPRSLQLSPVCSQKYITITNPGSQNNKTREDGCDCIVFNVAEYYMTHARSEGLLISNEESSKATQVEVAIQIVTVTDIKDVEGLNLMRLTSENVQSKTVLNTAATVSSVLSTTSFLSNEIYCSEVVTVTTTVVSDKYLISTLVTTVVTSYKDNVVASSDIKQVLTLVETSVLDTKSLLSNTDTSDSLHSVTIDSSHTGAVSASAPVSTTTTVARVTHYIINETTYTEASSLSSSNTADSLGVTAMPTSSSTLAEPTQKGENLIQTTESSHNQSFMLHPSEAVIPVSNITMKTPDLVTQDNRLPVTEFLEHTLPTQTGSPQTGFPQINAEIPQSASSLSNSTVFNTVSPNETEEQLTTSSILSESSTINDFLTKLKTLEEDLKSIVRDANLTSTENTNSLIGSGSPLDSNETASILEKFLTNIPSSQQHMNILAAMQDLIDLEFSLISTIIKTCNKEQSLDPTKTSISLTSNSLEQKSIMTLWRRLALNKMFENFQDSITTECANQLNNTAPFSNIPNELKVKLSPLKEFSGLGIAFFELAHCVNLAKNCSFIVGNEFLRHLEAAHVMGNLFTSKFEQSRVLFTNIEAKISLIEKTDRAMAWARNSSKNVLSLEHDDLSLGTFIRYRFDIESALRHYTEACQNEIHETSLISAVESVTSVNIITTSDHGIGVVILTEQSDQIADTLTTSGISKNPPSTPSPTELAGLQSVRVSSTFRTILPSTTIHVNVVNPTPSPSSVTRLDVQTGRQFAPIKLSTQDLELKLDI